MDIFAGLVQASRDALRQAALHAAHELGVFAVISVGDRDLSPDEIADALGVRPRRLRALLDVLALEGALRCERGRYGCAEVPAPPPPPPPQGWGQLVEVIRRDRPIATSTGFSDEATACARFHRYLGEAGAQPASRLVAHLSAPPDARLLDIGAGIGTYTEAWLSERPQRCATLVDRPEVLELARDHLAHHGERASYLPGDFLDVEIPPSHEVALLCNVLHLHPAADCARLIEQAAKAVVPGGEVVVKDLRIAPDRSGPVVGVYFALNMTLFTTAGDVHDPTQISAWMSAARLVDVQMDTLPDLPDAVLLRGRRRR